MGGQGLEAVSHTVGRGGHFRHVLTHFGTFDPGSPEQAMEDWVTASGGDPVALLLVLDTFVDTPLAALARITVPTLVLTGAEDGHNDTAEALASALGNGRYIMLPGNHGTAIATPQFETAITDFLGSSQPGRARELTPGGAERSESFGNDQIRSRPRGQAMLCSS